MFGNETKVFFKRISDGLALKWDKSYNEVMGWLRAWICCAESFYIVLERIANEVEVPGFGGWSTNWAIKN